MSEQLDRFNEQLLGLLTAYGMNALGAIITLVVGFAAAGWLARLTDRAMRQSQRIDAVFKPCRARSCASRSSFSR
ncbi:MAG: hypothetical protein Q8N44_03910 [Rubrivivax sp.]|nr:hypothetical protein [Rubrivivax sp.]MDP3082826.1 hypothetical protein [Rubrivivax sp.]